MVKGLSIFKEHFDQFSDKYVLIGGAACDLLMNEAGLEFRATKDLDVVLCIEILDGAFLDHFWNFILSGEYQIKQRFDGSKCFYRFEKPTNTEFPSMIELFSRLPDVFRGKEMTGITPIPINEEIVSLSAILIDDEYYNFIISQKYQVDGIPLVRAKCLIPLKVRAYIDMKERKENGEDVDSHDINKHKNDVFRLFQLLDTQNASMDVPVFIMNDIKIFVEEMASTDVNLTQLGIIGIKKEDVLKKLKEIYS